MPKQARLSRADFQAFSGRSRREHGRFFTLVVYARADAGGPRAACVVSKKTARRAADRNMIKRRVREVLRPLLTRVAAPLSLAFYAKKSATEAPFSELSEDIRVLVSRII